MTTQIPLGNRKPGQHLAFLAEADPEQLAECLVAFANSDGGLIVLGLNDSGRIAPAIWDEEAEAALRQAALRCRPPVASQWQRVETNQGALVGIQVSRSADLHSLEDGRVLVRNGNQNIPLTGHDIHQLAASKNSGDFERETVPGASQKDFDPETINEYLAKRESRGAAKIGPLGQFLFEIGAVNHDGQPTVAGILLFGKNPQFFLPQSGIVFVRFTGTEPRGEDGGAGYGRRDDLNGPLSRMVERAWNIVWDEMRVGAKINELERKELTEYPRFAVREALINAVAHRDYRLTGRKIELRMYSNRLEVISPGGLPGYITLDNLIEEHFSRNPRLVSGLYQWGYIEELGLGIDRMIEEMVQAGHPAPLFRASPHLFTVTLLAQERPAAPAWSRHINERQGRALAYVRENGTISSREYQQLCANVSPETLRLDLVDLVEKNLLLKIGSKKGTHYILK